MTEKELEKLYNEAYKAVYWTALSILKNKEDAEDVVQETFITAFEQYDSLKDKSKAVAWIKKIAANKSLNIVTRKRTVNVGDEVLEEVEDIAGIRIICQFVEDIERVAELIEHRKKHERSSWISSTTRSLKIPQ